MRAIFKIPNACWNIFAAVVYEHRGVAGQHIVRVNVINGEIVGLGHSCGADANAERAALASVSSDDVVLGQPHRLTQPEPGWLGRLLGAGCVTPRAWSRRQGLV